MTKPPRRFLHWGMPRRLRRILRWEVSLRRRLWLQQLSPRFHRRVRELRGQKELRLNLGASTTGREGWVNIDACPGVGVDFAWDLRTPLPLPNGCARCILCEHVLEHLSYPDEAVAFLEECRRLLRTGGVLRLVVPDALKYCRVICSGDWEEARRLRRVERYRTLMEMVNDVFRQDYEHQYAYDEETLRRLLNEAGFTKVERMPYGKSQVEGLAIEQQWRAEESLHLEAVARC